eukprot:SAG31_NODE_1149_length_9659_cov_4.862238_1_plen_168_part_00
MIYRRQPTCESAPNKWCALSYFQLLELTCSGPFAFRVAPIASVVHNQSARISNNLDLHLNVRWGLFRALPSANQIHSTSTRFRQKHGRSSVRRTPMKNPFTPFSNDIYPLTAGSSAGSLPPSMPRWPYYMQSNHGCIGQFRAGRALRYCSRRYARGHSLRSRPRSPP